MAGSTKAQAGATHAIRTTFNGHDGAELAARLDLPAGHIRGVALFAHCFTCSKDFQASRRISTGLAAAGIAVLRFDFTGLGGSGGDFANTNFSSNVADLIKAADHLRSTLEAPTILIGHSLGGAAVLAAAHAIPEARAVVTIGAPADVAHVLHNFKTELDTIRSQGFAEVRLAGRTFPITRDFVEDVEQQRLLDLIASLKKALLVLHAPLDTTVGIENASAIFAAAKHPKSFVSLDDADHLLTRASHANFAAEVIAAWATKYVRPDTENQSETRQGVVVAETGLGRFQNAVAIGAHRLLADEPESVGGLGSGPTPYEYLSAALGACTSMTLRMYADHKRLDLPRISVRVSHGKIAAEHCSDCGAAADGRTGRIDRFERIIEVDAELTPDLAAKLAEIADKCPVHKTIEGSAAIVTRVEGRS